MAETALYRGRLRIVDTNGDDLVHEEGVRLSYGAIFGPDVADLSRWQEIAMNVVDGRQDTLRNLGEAPYDTTGTRLFATI